MKSRVLMTLIVWIAGVALALSFGASPADTAERIVLSQEAVSQAIAVQAQHENMLISRPGVKGVGVGARGGQAGILILVDQQSRESEIPTTVGDMPVIVEEVGRIVAHQVMNLGESVGNDILCNGPGPCTGGTCSFCDVGTTGFKVCDTTAPNVGGFITNNHVAASGCPGKCPNNAPLGTNLFHPALVDNTPVCTTTGATNVGTLNRLVTIVLDGSTLNDVDAAFVQSTDALVSDNIQGLGLQSNTTAAVSVGDAVCKSGRTTGVTCGTITAINLTINVGYDQAGEPSPGSCGTGAGRFRNIVRYEPTAPSTVMSQGGDSGAPVVLNDGTMRAVAINFAGNTSGTQGFGIPIATVLAQLNVSLCSDIPEPPIADANGPYAKECHGTTTAVQLDGTGSSDPDPGDSIEYAWVTNCPGGVFDNANGASPILTIDTSAGCFISCAVTLTVTDGTGNVATDSAAVTVRDTTPPVIVCWPDRTMECTESSDPLNTGISTATDICTANPPVIFSDTVTPGACPQAWTISRTWTSTDNCGNSASCSQRIDVMDTVPPTLVGVPGDQTAQCDAVPPPAFVTATDNCDPSFGVVFTVTRADGSCPGNYTLTRTWTATDHCGNWSSGTQVIQVVDATDPVIQSVSAAPNVLWPPRHQMVAVTVSATASDNCDTTPVCAISDVISNEPQNGLGDGDTAPDWSITGNLTVDLRAERSGTGKGRVYTIMVTCTDACGNSALGTTTVSVPKSQK